MKQYILSFLVIFPLVVNAGSAMSEMPDTRAPDIGISGHSDRDTVKTSKLELRGTATDPDSGIKEVQVFLNNKAMTVSGSTNWMVALTLQPGKNTILVRATDNSNNTAELSLSLTFDDTIRTSSGVLLALSVILPLAFVSIAAALYLGRKLKAARQNGQDAQDDKKHPAKKTADGTEEE